MNGRTRNLARGIFPLAFVFSCFLFWWLPSVLLKLLGIKDTIKTSTLWISIGALVVFLIGYLIPQVAPKIRVVSANTTRLCNNVAYKASLVVFIPALLASVSFALMRLRVSYGEGGDIPLFYQAIFYTHLFLGYMFVASVPDFTGIYKKRTLIVSALLILPRLIVSLQWGRFFVGQSIFAILLIAMGRGWIRLSLKRWIQLAVVLCGVIFVPAITRGANILGQDQYGRPMIVDLFEGGNTLGFFQEYKDTLHSPCPPLLVSMTAQIVPYSLLGVCTINVGNIRNVPATINVLLTSHESNDLSTGTGGNFLLEFYLIAGVPAILLGSTLFGLSCRWFIEQIGHASIFAGIWSECLVRALFAPRNNLGYVFERIPSLVLATFLFIVLCKMIVLLQSPSAVKESI